MIRALDRFFRNPETGELVIAQWPNIPLAIFLVATAIRFAFDPRDDAATAVSVVGTLALTWWSGDEILRGDSPFRRVLGAIVLAGIVVRVLSGVGG